MITMNVEPIEGGKDHQGVRHLHILHVQVEDAAKSVYDAQQEHLYKCLENNKKFN